MLGTFVRKIFGSKNDREVKQMLKAVAAINEQESTFTHSVTMRLPRSAVIFVIE